MDIPALDGFFTPYKIGRCTLRNRFVMAPMSRNLCHTGTASEEMLDYYTSRAKGGVGLIITEGVYINHPGANGEPNVPAFFGQDRFDAWRRIVDSVHEAGGLIIPQLWHYGNQRRPGIGPDVTVPGYGPMEIREGGEVVVKEMTRQDMSDITEAFAQAAADAEAIGFDGVEIHGAHEYLLDNFIWKHQNQRQDDYGGSLENRLRFPLEVVRAVRGALRKDSPLFLRLSQCKLSDYEARIAETPEEWADILAPFSDAGVDVFDVSTRRFWLPGFEGSDMTLAAWAKEFTQKTTMTIGGVGIGKPLNAFEHGVHERADFSRLVDLAEGMERGDFDLVGVGRALIPEPDWVNKVQARDFASVRSASELAYASLVA